MKIRPQVLTAILAIFVLGLLVVVLAPTYIDKIVGAAITGIGMLAMKLVGNEGE